MTLVETETGRQVACEEISEHGCEIAIDLAARAVVDVLKVGVERKGIEGFENHLSKEFCRQNGNRRKERGLRRAKRGAFFNEAREQEWVSRFALFCHNARC